MMHRGGGWEGQESSSQNALQRFCTGEASGERGCLGTNPGLSPYSSLASSGLLFGVYAFPGPCYQASHDGLNIFLGVTTPPLGSSGRRQGPFSLSSQCSKLE